MIAIAIREPGGPQVLTPEERPRPAIGDRDVLIKVVAAGVNRPDIMQRLGKYPPPPGAPDIPGLEVAGSIEAVEAGSCAHPRTARARAARRRRARGVAARAGEG